MSKGGSTSTSVAVPEYIEEAAKRNLNKAERISQIGYAPYIGADVAALTPMQEAAAQNIADTASVFGTAGGNMSQQDIRGGMSEPTTFAGGVRGYSSAPMYEQSLEAFDEARPGQKEYIDSFFIDPYTGRAGSNVQAPIDYTSLTPGVSGDLGGINRGQTGGVDNSAEREAAAAAVAAAEAARLAERIAAAEKAAADAAAANEIYTPILDVNDQASTYITDPADGITDTSVAGTGTVFVNDAMEGAIDLAASTGLGGLLLGDSYKSSGVNNPNLNPTVQAMMDTAPENMIYQPNTGGYTSENLAPETSIRPVIRPEDIDSTAGGLLGTGFFSGLNLTGPLAEGNPGYITGGRTGNITDNDRPAGPGDTGYEQAALAENLTTGAQDGIIYADDRRQVWVGGEMVANVKSASEAKERLATAVANKPSPTTGFTQAQTDLAQALFAQGVPAAEVRAAVLAQ